MPSQQAKQAAALVYEEVAAMQRRGCGSIEIIDAIARMFDEVRDALDSKRGVIHHVEPLPEYRVDTEGGAPD